MEKNNDDTMKILGIECFANSVVYLSNGWFWYVEDPVETIDERMLDDEPTITFTISSCIRDVFETVYKDDVYDYCSA